MFRGRPAYMGMADDAVEYALETAMDALLRATRGISEYNDDFGRCADGCGAERYRGR